MGPQEHKLCEALEDWRDQKTVEIYGRSLHVEQFDEHAKSHSGT
jgi:hypothetical protein